MVYCYRLYKVVNTFCILAIIHTVESRNDTRAPDCSLKAQRIGTGLGSLVLIETLFCCFVLYKWIKKYRISMTKTKNHQTNDGDTQLPMYTEADSSSLQQPINTNLKNYEPLSEPKPVSSYQSLAKKRLEKRKSGTVLRRMRRILFRHETQSVENEVYYEPTRNEANNTAQAQMRDDADPESQLPQGTQGQIPDSLYYCSEDCIDTTLKGTQFQIRDNAYYHVLEDPESQAPQGPQGTESLYYCSEDCVDSTTKCTPQGTESLYYCSEDCVDSTTKCTPPKAIKPLSYVPKGKVAVSTSQKPLPYYHILESESKTTKKAPANQMAIKPLKCKPGLKDDVIQEMKNRAVQNKTMN